MEKCVHRTGSCVLRRRRSISWNRIVISIAVVALVVHAEVVAAQRSGLPPIDPGAQRFVKTDGIVIAYAETRLADGRKSVAMAVRTPIPEKIGLDDALSTKYTCELILLEEDGEEVRVTGRTDRAVSCSSRSNLTAGARVLDDNLQLTGSDVTFENLRDTAAKGSFSYSFHFDGKKWNLSAAKSYYSSHDEQGASVSVKESISYPEDFGPITMERFDPDKLKKAMSESKKVYED